MLSFSNFLIMFTEHITMFKYKLLVFVSLFCRNFNFCLFEEVISCIVDIRLVKVCFWHWIFHPVIMDSKFALVLYCVNYVLSFQCFPLNHLLGFQCVHLHNFHFWSG
jgi:hypothetical protein